MTTHGQFSFIHVMTLGLTGVFGKGTGESVAAGVGVGVTVERGTGVSVTAGVGVTEALAYPLDPEDELCPG